MVKLQELQKENKLLLEKVNNLEQARLTLELKNKLLLEDLKSKSDLLNNFDIQKNKYVFVEFQIPEKNKIKSVSGYFQKETNNHVKIWILDRKNNKVYSYILRKTNILGIKEYWDIEDKTELKKVLEIKQKEKEGMENVN